MVLQGGALVIPHLEDAVPYFFDVLGSPNQEPAEQTLSFLRSGPINILVAARPSEAAHARCVALTPPQAAGQ